MAKKPSFRNAFAKHRCVIVVDGFYEWKRDGKRKVPFYIFLKSRKPFSFAGLYEHWNDLDGNEIRSCTIITTDSNELVSPLHNRMPVILPEDDEELWLDPGEKNYEKLLSLLKPFSAKKMTAYEVGLIVNNTRHDASDYIAPVPTSPT